MTELCLADRALKALPADLRQILVAKHLTGMSYAELAEQFGVTEQVVAERLCEARRLLKENIHGKD